MKIKKVKVWKQDLENKRPYTIAFKTIDTVENVFVSVELENGITGIGSCNPSEPVVGESLDAAYRAAQDHSVWLEGRNIHEFEDLLLTNIKNLPANPGARSAIDVALHDAFTCLLGVPLVKFLGQRVTGLATSVTIGIRSVEETVAEAKEFIGDGFRILKVKLGHDVEIDVERLVKLRETFGDSVGIRVDANQGYTVEDLIWFMEKAGSLNLELVEQPLKKEDVASQKALPDEIKEVVAMDETVQVLKDAIEHVTPPISSRIMNIKLMKSGGVYEARRMAAVAEASSIDLMWGCNDESKASITASLHAAYSSPNTRYIDLDGSFDLARDVVKGGFAVRDGKMYPLLDKPGLGLEMV